MNTAETGDYINYTPEILQEQFNQVLEQVAKYTLGNVDAQTFSSKFLFGEIRDNGNEPLVPSVKYRQGGYFEIPVNIAALEEIYAVINASESFECGDAIRLYFGIAIARGLLTRRPIAVRSGDGSLSIDAKLADMKVLQTAREMLDKRGVVLSEELTHLTEDQVRRINVLRFCFGVAYNTLFTPRQMDALQDLYISQLKIEMKTLDNEWREELLEATEAVFGEASLQYVMDMQFDAFPEMAFAGAVPMDRDEIYKFVHEDNI